MISDIEHALSQHRYETARRLCVAAFKEPEPIDRNRLLLLQHRALRVLADWIGCRTTLEQVRPADDDQRLDLALLLGEDFNELSRYDHYRSSDEARQGLTGEEYEDKYKAISASHFKTAIGLANTPTRASRVITSLLRVGYKEDAARLRETLPLDDSSTPVPAIQPIETGTLRGKLTFPDGRPVSKAAVTLGLCVKVEADDPATFLKPQMHSTPTIGHQESITVVTDADGHYLMEFVPAGEHAFLAVTLDADVFDVHTRFVAQLVHVVSGKATIFDAIIDDWHSAPAVTVVDPFPAEFSHDGLAYRKVVTQSLRNPFYYPFPRQDLRISLPNNATSDASRMCVFLSTDAGHWTTQPFQIIDDDVLMFCELPRCSERTIAIYEVISSKSDSSVSRSICDGIAWQPAVHPDGTSAVIDTGRASFRIPWGSGRDAQPPLIQVRGEDRVWRGRGRLRLPDNVFVVERATRVLQSGPLLLQVEVAYQLSNESTYAMRFTAHRDEAYLLVHEVSPAIDGAAFEFSLNEFGGGRGRGFLHWTPESGTRHWSTLDATDRELARMQESVPWWVPPAGFGYAMTADGLTEKDYVGVFTIRRGDWIDRAFEKICRGPGNEPSWHRELDWPFPEMVGSTISMITAHTDSSGDAFFRFGMFDGERHWGILVSTLDRNDGPAKEISLVQHKNSSPRLDEFKNWHLDEPDRMQRPHVVVRREDLRHLRRKRTSPMFAKTWERLNAPGARGAAAGVVFAVAGDPLIAWRKKLELVHVAEIRSLMTLWGRDYSDMYSPVGARPITQWAEDYDLIAASGVFTPDEERLVRRFLMLMGHLYMSPDLMNWKYGSRNANFEADRTDVVGTIGLVFRGNPDADAMLDHVVTLMEQSLDVYCTPGSGRWYENPSCYYLQASKCRLNLGFHLAAHDVYDVTTLPRMKEFLNWGILLLTPPCPHSYSLMRDGTTAAEYAIAEKVRRIAPIGDHALLGPWIPEHYAMMSKLYRAKDPEFADTLLWAYLAGGADGGYFGNLPLFFAALDEEDLTPPAAPHLISRKLEGFGSVFRGGFQSPGEFFLLLKQGPGGYRYHRTEGSIILFADGKPLIYDGGEAGETWRHSTLSFYDNHLPLAPGHVERFHSTSVMDFNQGVHPVVIRPDQPIQFNDNCSHELVPAAFERYKEPRPADVRSVVWVKDEYVIVHDDLDVHDPIAAHWHLQPVADNHTGNWHEGYIFKGRFGIDLQVLLPGQTFDRESIERLPMLEYNRPVQERFTTYHVALSNLLPPKHYLAVLRPMAPSQSLVRAYLLSLDGQCIGVHIDGDDLNDDVLFARAPFHWQTDSLAFAGRYGAVLRRGSTIHLLLMDAGSLILGTTRIQTNGPAVHLELAHDRATVQAYGDNGTVIVEAFGRPELQVKVNDGLAMRHVLHR